MGLLEKKHGKRKIYVSFDCETLKAEDAAEDHIRKFMPKLAGMGAVGIYLSIPPPTPSRKKTNILSSPLFHTS